MDERIHPKTRPKINRGVELCKFLAVLTSPVAAALFFRFAPDGAERFYPRCAFYAVTGLYCPGCGTLRALQALGRLDFQAAFLYNPFLFIIIGPLAVYMCVIFLMRAMTGRWVPSILSSYKAALPAMVIVVAIWIVRNIFRV